MITRIVNASVRTVTQAMNPMPSGRDLLSGWFKPLALVRVRKIVEDFQTREVEEAVDTQGAWQPFGPEELKILPEGERSWRWFMLHATPDLVLLTDDVVIKDTVKYRVMAKNDYTENGYVEYRVVNAYDASPK